jgi:hypothetical protein
VVDRDKAPHLADVIAEEFPVPAEFLDQAVETITGSGSGSGSGTGPTTGTGTGTGVGTATRRRAASYLPVQPADWPRSRDAMVGAILASATPEREDRLFPGDVAQFSDGGGIGLAHGAAGVLYALAETGAGRYEAGEQWLLRRTDPPPPGTLLGFYDGLLGTAFVLDRLGHTPRALDLTERVLGEKWQRLVPDLYGGLAGVGLALESLSRTTGEDALREKAVEAAQLLADRLSGGPANHIGLLRGATGSALLFLRLYERTGAPGLLDAAATALRRDLARCRADREGTLVVDEGSRTMPYLGAGSVGIGMVLDDYLAHRPDEEFERARAAILPAARSRYYAQPGLFNGRAGMVLHLARTTAPDAAPGHLAAQIAALGWYAMPYQGHLAFPGDQMMRLSMDLTTGTAGCLLALGAALGEQPAALPFLPPLQRPQNGPFTGSEKTTPSP